MSAKRKPYMLDVPPLPLERFTLTNKDHLSTFESDLRSGPFDGTFPWLHRLYDDAADVGIAIRSHHTGQVVYFHLEDQEERDGEIVAWHFKPIPGETFTGTVTIFND